MLPKFRIWDGSRMIYDPSIGFVEGKYTYSISDIFNNYDTEPMMSTGLPDKDGKEIYEGDIVKFKDKYYGVYRDEEYLEYYLMNGEDNEPMYSYTDYEVIGNIYENPEMLIK